MNGNARFAQAAPDRRRRKDRSGRKMTTEHVNAGSLPNSGDIMATHPGHWPKRVPRLVVDALVVAGCGLLRTRPRSTSTYGIRRATRTSRL